MVYFSNGTEGMAYEERYCNQCVHQGDENNGCVVWLAHMLYNYEECNKDESILHILIPRTKDKTDNKQCEMFLPSKPESVEVKEANR